MRSKRSPSPANHHPLQDPKSTASGKEEWQSTTASIVAPRCRFMREGGELSCCVCWISLVVLHRRLTEPTSGQRELLIPALRDPGCFGGWRIASPPVLGEDGFPQNSSIELVKVLAMYENISMALAIDYNGIIAIDILHTSVPSSYNCCSVVSCHSQQRTFGAQQIG